MNNEQLEDLMYRAGLTAQGCWDSMDQYDREAIMDFAKLVAAEKEKQIINILERLQQHPDFHNYYAYAIDVIRQEQPR